MLSDVSWRTDSWRAVARFGFCSQFSSLSTDATAPLDWRELCNVPAAASVSLYGNLMSAHHLYHAAPLTWTLGGRWWSLLSMFPLVGSLSTGSGYCYQQALDNKWGMSDTSPLACFPHPANKQEGVPYMHVEKIVLSPGLFYQCPMSCIHILKLSRLPVDSIE